MAVMARDVGHEAARASQSAHDGLLGRARAVVLLTNAAEDEDLPSPIKPTKNCTTKDTSNSAASPHSTRSVERIDTRPPSSRLPERLGARARRSVPPERHRTQRRPPEQQRTTGHLDPRRTPAPRRATARHRPPGLADPTAPGNPRRDRRASPEVRAGRREQVLRGRQRRPSGCPRGP